ncbi:MAG TPA: nitronate monooxygenase, partial [Acidimicrobiales bacterium]|nr:nitronate monooxygenase [Acidimicrobiales bacterium]
VTAGADAIVAQGTEGGGHGGRRSTLPLVPAVVDAVAPTPVLAAGGITDGRGLAAALALGAHGAVLGTRFAATPEALGPAWTKARLVAASGDRTTRTRVFDAARGIAWPPAYTGRALANAFIDTWTGREEELAGDATARDAFAAAQREGDADQGLVWAGEGIDLLEDVAPAEELVARIVARAAEVLATGPGALD